MTTNLTAYARRIAQRGWALTLAGALSLTAAMSAGAAASAQDAQQITAPPEPPRCVSLRRINGYSVIDDRHLLLRAGANRQYLVTTRSRCNDLRFGSRIATTIDGFGRLCQPIVEFIIPEHGHRCAIDTIEEVADREAANALIEARAAWAAQQRDTPSNRR